MHRNRGSTEQKLLDAVAELVVAGGFAGLGVNAVAKAAGVDKVLIYRYFGGLDGLLEAFVLERDYYANLDRHAEGLSLVRSREDLVVWARELMVGQYRALREDPVFREIVLWQVTTDSPVTQALAAERERRGTQLLERLRLLLGGEGPDLPAVTALLTGGAYYLALASERSAVFNGIDLRSDDGRHRIEAAIETVVSLVITATPGAFGSGRNNE
ncbi:MAG: TetR/AcrR family transcriptional regulator [Deltaproteobacteria bacterium]|nr:TetR/AcrR family transcriptional regulator [Deltaproteobacteria bacterium]